MLEFFRQLVSGVTQTWRRLSISARVQLGLAALLTILLIAGAALFGSQAQYGQLYTGLDLDEANEINVWLTDNEIPSRSRDGGTTIEVPLADVVRSRVGLAAQNLPKSQGKVPGFELFDKTDLMTNKFLQNVEYMRAMQGGLQRQLNQFDFIRNSFVFIHEAPDSFFIGEQKPSQAAVTLDTNGNLTPMQVKAVLQIVSSYGGANLPQNNIAITDTNGNVLHAITENGFASIANDKLGVQVAYEQRAQQKLNDAFSKIPVKAVFTVSAILDWTAEDVKDRKLNEGVEISKMVTTNTTRDVSPKPGGAPGAVANIPEELGRPGEEGIITEEKETITNNEPSETLRTTKSEPGWVKQYKVSAFIDPGYEAVLDANNQPVLDTAGKAQMQPKTFTPAQITQYSDFIQNAVSAGGTVETEVVVFPQPFNLDQISTGAQPGTLPGVPWTEATWFNWVWRIGLVALMFLVIRFLMRRALVIPAEEEEIIEIPEASPAERRQQEIAAEVERLSQQEPDTVAALLRTWMNEE